MDTTTRTRPRFEECNAGGLQRNLAIVWFEGGGSAGRGLVSKLHDGLVLGRSPNSDCVLPGQQVSRHHARVEVSHGLVVLRDLGSKNGTAVNGARCTVAALSDQDVVRIGEWVGIVCFLAPDTTSFAALFSRTPEGLLLGPRTAEALHELQHVAPTDLRVTLVGETGTGKEVFARELHRLSGVTGPFVAINCAAIPQHLAESELFGYRRGAFTGADRTHAGLFRAAHGGTLFLDEVTDLPLSIQSKVLRVLEERQVLPLGQSTPEVADPRVVCASQTPLLDKVEAGQFRSDLYARLHGAEIRLLPLRRRREELLPLLAQTLERRGAPATLNAAVMEQLLLYDWPMNVREATQLGARLAVMDRQARELRIEHLPEQMAKYIRPQSGPSAELSNREVGSTNTSTAPPEALETTSKPRRELAERLVRVLRETGGNVSAAAERIGISRPTAYRLLKRHAEVQPEEIRLAAPLSKGT